MILRTKIFFEKILLAWGIKSQFWTDGVAASSTWNWSSQPITWYFNSTDQAINYNGSYYQIVYNTMNDTYNIVDSTNTKLSSFICEYQGRFIDF